MGRALAVVLLLAVSPAWAGPLTLPFISEYVEGTGFDKAIELFNPGLAAVDLGADGYRLGIFVNGSAVATRSIGLEGVLASGAVRVVAHSRASAALMALADQVSGALGFNGDDAVALYRGDELLDVIGEIGVDPGTAWTADGLSTKDRTLRRKPASVTDGFDLARGWVGFGPADWDGLGRHAGLAPRAVDAPSVVTLTLLGLGLILARQVTSLRTWAMVGADAKREENGRGFQNDDSRGAGCARARPRGLGTGNDRGGACPDRSAERTVECVLLA